MGLEPTTFELEVQCASPLRHRGWLGKNYENLNYISMFLSSRPWVPARRSILAEMNKWSAFVMGDGDISQNPTYHHMPGAPTNKIEQNFHFCSVVRPSASNEIDWNPEPNLYRTKSNVHGFDIEIENLSVWWGRGRKLPPKNIFAQGKLNEKNHAHQ